MTQVKKATKTTAKAGKNFIKLDSPNEDPKVEDVESNVQIRKTKTIISGSKEAVKTRGVVYVSHIPHGFYEKQMKNYFEQFGSVTNIKLGRSEKTGSSRGYAFVEFRFHEVAKTVAETMNNYLFFDKLLKCELVAEDKVRPSMFRNKINSKRPPLIKARSIAKKQVNKDRNELQEQKRRRKQLQTLKKKAATLKSLGVECNVDFPSIEKEIVERKTRLKANGGKTPTMEVDDSDLDITLKTPPMVRKIKSRSNSTATPRQGSAQISEASMSKTLLKKRKLAMKTDVVEGNNIKNIIAKVGADLPVINAKPYSLKKDLQNTLNSKKKLLTPDVKSKVRASNSTPKSAQKSLTAKGRRRSEPVKMIS